MIEHPKAIAAKLIADADRALRALHQQKLENDIADLSTRFKLSFIDITPSPERSTPGMTIAYSGTRVLKVATGIRNPSDQYSKLEGRYAAACAFRANRFIHLRNPCSGTQAKKFLRAVFSY